MTKTLRPRRSAARHAPDLSNYRIDVRISSRINLLDDSIDEYDYFSEFNAAIKYSEDESVKEALAEPEVGRINGFFTNYTAMCNAGETVFWSFDAIDQETHEAYCVVFSGEHWAPWVVEYMRDHGVQLPRHLLYLRFMELDAAHRGKGVGMALLQRILRHPFIPSSTLVLACPFAVGIDFESDAARSARAVIANGLQSIGFLQAPKTIRDAAYYVAMVE